MNDEELRAKVELFKIFEGKYVKAEWEPKGRTKPEWIKAKCISVTMGGVSLQTFYEGDPLIFPLEELKQMREIKGPR